MSEVRDGSELSGNATELSVDVVLDGVPDPVLVFGASGGEVVEANDAAGDLFGHPAAELVGRTWSDLVTEVGLDGWRTALEGRDGGVTARVETADGPRPVRVDLRRPGRESGPVVGGFRPVGDGRAGGREAASGLFENYSEPAVVYEFVAEEPVVAAVNDAFERTFGVEAGRAVGTPVDRLVVPPERAGRANALDERARRGEPFEELAVRRAADEERAFRVRNVPLPGPDPPDGVAIYEDLAGRAADERRLRRTVERLETFLEATPIPVAVFDGAGAVEVWNRAAERTFGYEAEELDGKPYPLFPDTDEFDRLFGEAVEGRGLDGVEATLQARDGSLLDVEVHARPLYRDGEFAGVIAAALDRGDLRRREQQLAVLHRVMRHDLRNKLNVIRGFADRLLSEGDPEGSDPEHAARIVEAADDLAALSERAGRIRRTLRTVDGDAGRARLDELLADVADRAEAEYPHADVAVAADPVRVPRRYREVVAELVENGIEHNDRDAPSVEVRAESDGRRVTVTVTDDGPGIPEGERALIEAGEETSLRHGSGLSLARVYLMVTAAGGEVSVRDADPRGTVVELRLPCGEADPVVETGG